MKAQSTKLSVLVAVLASLSVSCGDVATSSRAPGQLVIVGLTAAAGTSGVPSSFPTSPGPLLSDVSTNGSIFNDYGLVTMRLVLRDPGNPGVVATPSALNHVTITRYRVIYRRADGREQPGVDIPHSFDGAVTFTVAEDDSSGVFELVRHIAKAEPPLRALTTNPVVITAMAEVTFYGRDQAGNEVSATGYVQVSFGNFADPSTS